MKQVPVLKIMGNKEKTRELPDLYSEKVYVVYYDVIISDIFFFSKENMHQANYRLKMMKGFECHRQEY